MTITKEWSAFVRRRQAPGGRTMLVLNQAARVCGLCLLLSQACSRIIRSGRERLGRFLSGGAAAAAGISYRGCNEPLAEDGGGRGGNWTDSICISSMELPGRYGYVTSYLEIGTYVYIVHSM